MGSLILHPTSTAQWQALLNEAQQSSAITLTEELEAYLVFLLMRFTTDPGIASSVLGLDFLNGYHASVGAQQQATLKDVGDKCLLFAGLFPGRAAKKRVKISYFVKLGQTAYATLAQYLRLQEALFSELCLDFPKLMDVLQAMRDPKARSYDLLQALELWQETGSQNAYRQVCAATNALPVSLVSHKKLAH